MCKEYFLFRFRAFSVPLEYSLNSVGFVNTVVQFMPCGCTNTVCPTRIYVSLQARAKLVNVAIGTFGNNIVSKMNATTIMKAATSTLCAGVRGVNCGMRSEDALQRRRGGGGGILTNERDQDSMIQQLKNYTAQCVASASDCTHLPHPTMHCGTWMHQMIINHLSVGRKRPVGVYFRS